MNERPELSQDEFDFVRRHAPLVSIDLIIQDKRGRVLVGLRNNTPAKRTWFVPGGRIRKDEGLPAAFKRIVCSEMENPPGGGTLPDGFGNLKFEDAKFYVCTDHHYGPADGLPFSVHYVVLSYCMTVNSCDEVLAKLPIGQHSRWLWAQIDQIVGKGEIDGAAFHENTRRYFLEPLRSIGTAHTAR
jgi:colanic acid biosynthesis protein WcaH